ncbi:MAG: hypothetical protein H5T86_07155, partial [Armatimonadetes bacterium]|nr:hypothetical protein [Armatimonadota bacterium]
IEEVAVALLEDVPCGHPGEIASRLADFLAADGMPALEVSLDGRPMTIELGEIVSPALIGGIVKSAAMRAFDERPEDARVTWRHVAAAIDEVVPEYLDRIAGAGQQALATTLPRYAAGRVGHIRVAYRAQPALRL